MISRPRAHSEDEKKARREAILAVARRQFSEIPYTSLSMARIAEEAGLGKATIYLYFESKEDLFLAALERDAGAWLVAVDLALDGLPAGAKAGAVAGLLADTLAESRDLPRLFALLAAIGGGPGDQRFDDWKTWWNRRSLQTAVHLERVLGWPPKTGPRALLQIHALVVGLSALGDRFDSEARAAFRAILRGTKKKDNG